MFSICIFIGSVSCPVLSCQISPQHPLHEMEGKSALVLAFLLFAYTREATGRCWSKIPGSENNEKSVYGKNYQNLALSKTIPFVILFLLRTESKPDHRLLEITKEFHGDSLTLRCAIDPATSPLQQGQRLVWREGGNEVQSQELNSGAWNVKLSETWTSSQLTFTNFSLSQRGEYTCQCENDQYTVDEITQVLAGVTDDFRYRCSKLQNITIGANGEHNW